MAGRNKEQNWVIIIGIILVVFIFLWFLQKNQDNKKIIGGERDKNRCLIPAGYSWNETEKECVREWLLGEDRYQVTDFQTCSDTGYPVLESYPRQCRTPGGRLFVEEP